MSHFCGRDHLTRLIWDPAPVPHITFSNRNSSCFFHIYICVYIYSYEISIFMGVLPLCACILFIFISRGHPNILPAFPYQGEGVPQQMLGFTQRTPAVERSQCDKNSLNSLEYCLRPLPNPPASTCLVGSHRGLRHGIIRFSWLNLLLEALGRGVHTRSR